MNGAQLKAIRERRGWSQEQMAAEIGVSCVLLGQMERGQAPIEPRTEYLVNRMREFLVELGPLEAEARAMMTQLRASHEEAVPGGNAAELVGLRLVETGEVMGVSRLKLEISGDQEEQRKQIESIFKSYVSEAVCEIWDYGHKYRCGLILDGRKIEVPFTRRGVTEKEARAQAELLAEKVASSAVLFHNEQAT